MIPGSEQELAIVVIGRNEGERLKSCLRLAVEGARAVVYVDSGSQDKSAEFAKSMGCRVVELDPSRPFSAARARNEGFDCAVAFEPGLAFVQFVDGDCELAEGWLERGAAALIEQEDAGVACGHLRERFPDASLYNKMCDLEWQQAPGEIDACGGIFMVRSEVFKAVGGFRPDVIAAEDDEFCVRVRSLGWRILLVDTAMARHDAAMTQFSEWWHRAMRAGHAYAQVADLHGKGEEHYFVRERRRIWLWGALLPLVALGLAPFTYGISLSVMLCVYALQFVRIWLRGRKRGWEWGDASTYAFFTVLAKFPGLAGLLAYYWRKGPGHALTIIEHKRSS